MILEVKNIYKSYHNQMVLNNICLAINYPRLIALIAPNGSGKTTLLNIICNIEKPDFGKISINSLSNTDIGVFKNLSYMQDNSILYDDLTGIDHINLVKSIHLLDDGRVDSVLDDLQMKDYIHKKVKFYSLGMKQHLLFALSILPRPKILLMDEPFNGLDPASTMRVRNILEDFYKKGTTIIFSSHNLDQIDKLTDDLFFLKNGKIISYKNILCKEKLKSYEVIIDDANKFYKIIKKNNLKISFSSKHKCTIKCTYREMKELYNLNASIILEYHQKKLPLEEIYFNLFEDFKV